MIFYIRLLYPQRLLIRFMLSKDLPTLSQFIQNFTSFMRLIMVTEYLNER